MGCPRPLGGRNWPGPCRLCLRTAWCVWFHLGGGWGRSGWPWCRYRPAGLACCGPVCAVVRWRAMLRPPGSGAQISLSRPAATRLAISVASTAPMPPGVGRPGRWPRPPDRRPGPRPRPGPAGRPAIAATAPAPALGSGTAVPSRCGACP